MDRLLERKPDLYAIVRESMQLSSYLWEKGWAERNAGNLSVDVTEYLTMESEWPKDAAATKFDQNYPNLAARYFLVTGSGHRYRDLAKDALHNVCILKMDEDGGGFRIVWGGEGEADFRPTSEFPSHLRIHEHLRKSGSEARVVLHTHPTEMIVLSHFPEFKNEKAFNRVLWSVHPEVKVTVPRGVGFVPYVVPGSEKLAVATVEAFRNGHDVAFWEMHGCVAVGKDLMQAFDFIDTLNKAAQIYLLCRSAGCVPEGLSKQNLNELVREFRLKE